MNIFPGLGTEDNFPMMGTWALEYFPNGRDVGIFSQVKEAGIFSLWGKEEIIIPLRKEREE